MAGVRRVRACSNVFLLVVSVFTVAVGWRTEPRRGIFLVCFSYFYVLFISQRGVSGMAARSMSRAIRKV